MQGANMAGGSNGECWVYGLHAVGSTEYFYVGSTKKTVDGRLREHLDYVRNGRNRNRHFVNKVLKVGPDNVRVATLESVSRENRFDREYFWISRLIDEGHPLTNIVMDPTVYSKAKVNCDIWDKINTPGWLLEGLELALQEGVKTADPRYQRLYDGMREAALAMFARALEVDPGGTRLLLFGAES